MTLTVLIDWENNNSFADAIDNISADVMSCSWKLGFREAFEDMAAESQATVVVKNTDGKYTPENASSPLYGYLLPHRRMKIQDIQAGGTATLWTGWIEFPSVKWQPGGSNTGKTGAVISGIGAKSLLQNRHVQLGWFEDVTGDDVIDDVLQQAQLPPAVSGLWILGQVGSSELGQSTYLGSVGDYSAIDTGITTIPVYGDVETGNAWNIIKEITQAERGRFFFDRDGKATWWNRHHLLSDITDDASVNTQSGDYKPVKLGYNYGEHLANIVRVKANPRRTESSQVLWELDAPITIQAAGTAEFDARLRKSTGQFVGSGALIEAPTWSSGTGTVVATANGGVAHVVATNMSTTAVAVLGELTLTGVPKTDQNNISVEELDTDSTAVYGKREFSLDLGPLGTYEAAKNVALFELERRKTPVGNVAQLGYTRRFDGSDNAHMVDWVIGTRLALTVSEFSHSADYFVIGEEHEWSPGQDGGIHESVFRLEPAVFNAFWILGVAGYSELGETTTLVY